VLFRSRRNNKDADEPPDEAKGRGQQFRRPARHEKHEQLNGSTSTSQ